MTIQFHRHFKKQYMKLPKKAQKQFDLRLELLIEDRSHPLLHIHKLTGTKHPLESMNVNADTRTLFIQSRSTITFYEIGTHSELYR